MARFEDESSRCPALNVFIKGITISSSNPNVKGSTTLQRFEILDPSGSSAEAVRVGSEVTNINVKNMICKRFGTATSLTQYLLA